MIADAPEWVYTFRCSSPKRAEFLLERPAYVRALPAKKSMVDRALANLNSWSLHDEARLRGALSFIPANIDGQTWYAMAGALFDLEWIIEDVDIGLELFNDFSARSEGVGPGNGEYKGRGDIEKRWQAFVDKNHAGPRTTRGTIFALAEKHGWKGEVLERPLAWGGGEPEPAGEMNGANGQHALPESFYANEAEAIVFPDRRKGGHIAASCLNAVTAIKGLGVTCELDRFHDRYLVGGKAMNEWVGELSDEVVQIVRVLIRETYKFDPGTTHTCDALIQQCLANNFHPIKNYFGTLQWDGVKRLDTWMSRYLGAGDSPFVRAVGRLALIAAVRRVLQPGCKFDHIIVLEGPEGRGKSTAIEILAGRGNFSDQTLLNVDDRAQQEALSGVWLYEIADLAGHSRAEVERVKAFASRTHDRARPAYGRRRVDRPRTCVLFATTNDLTYLQSQTGNRRFWPVGCGRIDLEALRADRDQLWAEALLAERGASLVLSESLWGEAAALQDARREHDPWDGLLAGDLGFVVDGMHGPERRVMTHELLQGRLQIPPDRQSSVAAKRLAYVMRRLGWDGPKNFKDGEAVCKGYTRPTGSGEVAAPVAASRGGKSV